MEEVSSKYSNAGDRIWRYSITANHALYSAARLDSMYDCSASHIYGSFSHADIEAHRQQGGQLAEHRAALRDTNPDVYIVCSRADEYE